METPEFTAESLKMLLIVGFLTLTANTIATDTGALAALPGMLIIVAIGLAALVLGRVVPLNLPAFAYAMIISFVLAIPFSPVQGVFLEYVERVGFLATTTPILAYAGLSIGLQTGRMKEVSWKLVIVAVFVFFGTFFGSALIAELILKAQGII